MGQPRRKPSTSSGCQTTSLTSPAFWGDGFGMTREDRGMSTTCRTLSREPRLRPQQAVLERRRLAAAALFTKDLSSATVARRLGVSRQSAHRWSRAWQAGGVQALRTRGPIGRHRKLTVAHLDQLEHALVLGAVAHGFAGNLWTLDRITEVIWRLPGCATSPCRSGGSSPSAWAGACNAHAAGPPSATRPRSTTGWRSSGRGSKGGTPAACLGGLPGRERHFPDPGRLPDLGATRPAAGPGSPLPLAARLDVRRDLRQGRRGRRAGRVRHPPR